MTALPGARLVAFDERFRFDTFVAGPATRAAVDALRALADGASPGAAPILVAGPAGTGKSHLLGALSRRARERDRACGVVVVSGADAVDDWAPLDGARLLLVDDAQAAAPDHLARLVGDATVVGATVVGAWTTGGPRHDALGTWHVLRVGGPDVATRHEIVRRAIVARGLSLPADVVSAIVEREASDVRELLGAVTRAGAAATSGSGSPLGATTLLDDDFASFLDEVAREVAPHAEPWRLALGEAATRWRGEGFAVDVLDRALRLATAPDVDALLATFAAAIERLRALEAEVRALDADAAGDASLRDPARVADAEALAARVRARVTPRASAASAPRPTPSLVDAEGWVIEWPDVADLLVERWS